MERNFARRMGAWLHPYLDDNSSKLVFGNKILTWYYKLGKDG